MLRSLVLALHHNSRGQMSDSNRGIGSVDVLSACARGSVGIHAQVFVVDLDLDILVDLWVYKERCKRGVSAGSLIEGRDPYQPVNARLGREQAVGVLPSHR